MSDDIKTQVEWFLENLDLQLEDHRLEKDGVSVRLYFDTADVRDAVLGMQVFYAPDGSFNRRLFKSARTMVRCLATSGWLGKIRMLPSHQAEFLTLMNVNFGFSHEPDTISLGMTFLADVQALLGMDSVNITALGKPLHNEEDEQQLLEFVAQMREQAQSAEVYFIALESLGHWRSRMARWIREGTLQLESESLKFGSTLTSPNFRALKDAFDARRPSTNRMNNFADATAVAMLIDQVTAFNEGSKLLPRFFFPSKLFYEAVERAGVLDCLSYKVPYRDEKHFRQPVKRTVLTSSDYFRFKSVFSPSAQRGGRAGDSSTLNLYDLRSLVADILQTQGPLTEQTIRSIDVAGRPLSQIIDEVRRFSFLKNIWLPFLELDYVKRTTDLQRQARDLTHLRAVKKAIRATKEAIEESAKEYKRVRSLWRELEQAMSNLHARVHYDPTRPLDAFRDLGLLRFGFPSSSHEAIRGIVEPIFSGGETEQIAARNLVITAYYADRMRIAEKSERTTLIRAAAVMWLARMDIQLLELLREIHQSRGLPHFSLELVYAASAFRLANQLEEGQQILHKLTNYYAGIPSRERQTKGDLAVGIAYLFFHSWWCAGYRPFWYPPTDGTLKPRGKEGRQLINHAIDYAKKAYDLAAPTDLRKRAYILNQRLYYLVMGSGNDRLREIDLAFSSLVQLKSNHDVWQHRFDDTLARYFHRQATRAESEETWKIWMKQAREHFDAAKMFDYGDEQVQAYGSIVAADEAFGFGRKSLQQDDLIPTPD